MLTGIKQELVHPGFIQGKNEDMMMVSTEDNNCEDDLEQYVDDISGRPVSRERVQEARAADM